MGAFSALPGSGPVVENQLPQISICTLEEQIAVGDRELFFAVRP